MVGKKLTQEYQAALRAEMSRFKANRSKWEGFFNKPYSPEFNAPLKRQIRARDGYECRHCGITESQLGKALDVHHRDGDKQNNDPTNLISLCTRCHGKVPYGTWRRKRGRLMRGRCSAG